MRKPTKRKTPDSISKKRQKLHQEIMELKEKKSSVQAGYVLTLGRAEARRQFWADLIFLDAEIDSRYRELDDLAEKGRKPWVDKSWH